MKIRPLAEYVLIEPVNDNETTASGLIMPEKAKEKPEKGIIIECGWGNKKIISNYLGGIKIVDLVGKKVIFHRWSGQDIKEGQKEYKLVKFSDLMGMYE